VEDGLYRDPVASAKAAGLHYIMDDVPGFQRKRWGRGFAFFDPKGKRVQKPELRARFEALVIPPAWTEVWISPDIEGHIQATGRDTEGRKQYIYHPHWEEVRNLAKFSRMVAFGEALPLIRTQVETALRQRNLTRQKVVALVVRLLEETLIRIGNVEYARRNDSYGLTTLTDDNLEVSGNRISLRFRGKHGKDHEIDLHNPRLARMVKRCQDLPGQELFQYIDDEGQTQPVNSQDVNDYLRTVTGQDFTAKDFRTWGGTLLAATEFYRLGPCEIEKELQKNIREAVKAVAAVLGNTTAVCRSYYIHPAVINAYLEQNLCKLMAETFDASEKTKMPGLTVEETAVLALLRKATD
jgi:DNA topoisomerase-1